MDSADRRRILITVLTYPHPSRKYKETVCTAGITEDGQWVRLYPLPLRSLPREQQLRKWHWVELGTLPPTNDVRPESRRPLLDDLVIGKKLDPAKDREERRRLIDLLPHRTLAGWELAYEQDKTSLGVLVPRRVLDVEHMSEDDDWTEAQKSELSQLDLFADRTSAKETHCSILLEKDGSEHWDASINWPRWFSVPNSDDREVDGTPSASIDPHNSATILRRCQVLPAVREVLIV